jgi:hypothetical protein
MAMIEAKFHRAATAVRLFVVVAVYVPVTWRSKLLIA